MKHVWPYFQSHFPKLNFQTCLFQQRNQKKCFQGGSGATAPPPFWHDYFQPTRKGGRVLTPPKYLVLQRKLFANAPQTTTKCRKTPQPKHEQNTTLSQQLLYFFTSRAIYFHNPKGTLYSRHRCDKLRNNVRCHDSKGRHQLHFQLSNVVIGQKFEKLLSNDEAC